MKEKKYFWLKLPTDFFTSKRLKKLRSIAGGDTLTIIYLKMQLKALKTGGFLYYDELCPDFAEELAIDIDENPDNVRITIQFLLSCGLLECDESGKQYYLTYMQNLIGSETSTAQRVRKFREREKQKMLQCNTNVTECNENVNGEIEIEKEIDIDIDRDINISYENKNFQKSENAKKIIDLFNQYCPSLPKVTKLTDKRTKTINARLKEYTEEEIIKAFILVEQSDFLTGRSGKWSGASFDWIINPNNLVKILENNYINKSEPNPNEKLNNNQTYAKEHKYQNANNPDFLKELENETKNRP